MTFEQLYGTSYLFVKKTPIGQQAGSVSRRLFSKGDETGQSQPCHQRECSVRPWGFSLTCGYRWEALSARQGVQKRGDLFQWQAIIHEARDLDRPRHGRIARRKRVLDDGRSPQTLDALHAHGSISAQTR